MRGKMRTEMIDKVVEEVIKEEYGVFDCVFKLHIRKFLLSVASVLDKSSNVRYNYKKCLKSIGKVIKSDLIEICQRTMIGNIYLEKDKLIGFSDREKYDNFCENYLLTKYNSDFNEDKTLNKIVQIKLNNRLSSIEEFICRIDKDFKCIKEPFELETNEISNISIGEGDTHNGGRSVFIIEIGSGKKIIYKPHTLENDGLFNKFLDILNGFVEIKYPLRKVKIINRGEYGWQEFIQTTECKSTDEIERYMYRFGMIVAVSYLFNTTDLHFENIIAQGEDLFVIDLETLFFNNTLLRRAPYKMEDGIGKMLRHSIYNSALLPSNFLFVHKDNSIDFSGLTGGYKEMMYRTLVVVDRCTPNIRFEERVINVKDGMSTGNIVRINGETIEITDYVNCIVEGFSDSYKSFINHRDKLMKLFEGEFWKSGVYRQVVRYTQLYYKFLQASTHPYYIEKEDARHSVFSKLYSKCEDGSIRKKLGILEEEQLLNMDIPFFYTKYDSVDLYTCNGKKIENFYFTSLKDIIIDNLKKLSKQDLRKQIYFIKVSSMETVQQKDRIKNATSIFDEKVMFKDNDDIIIKLANNILNSYTLANSENKFNNMVTVGENEHGGFSLDILHFGMYYGGGVANTLLQLYCKYGEPRYCNIALGMIRTYNDKLSQLEKIDVGVFSGIGSLLWLNYNAYVCFREQEYYNNCNTIIDYLMTRKEKSDDALDIMSGYAGLIILLGKLFESIQEEKILDVMKKYLDLLVKRLDIKNALTGFAHGLAGISSALIFSKKYFGDTYYLLGIECIQEENKYFSEEYSNWLDKRNLEEEPYAHWCYGATGILAARMIVLDQVTQENKNIIQADIDRCINRIITQKFDGENMKYNLCHGILGNLDILSSYLKRYPNDLRAVKYLEEQHKVVMEKIKNNYYVSEIPLDVISTDFMTGITGLIYYLLRTDNTNITSLLLLEIDSLQ